MSNVQNRNCFELNEHPRIVGPRKDRYSRPQDEQIEHPQIWLNDLASKVYGHDLKLQIVESFDER